MVRSGKEAPDSSPAEHSTSGTAAGVVDGQLFLRFPLARLRAIQSFHDSLAAETGSSGFGAALRCDGKAPGDRVLTACHRPSVPMTKSEKRQQRAGRTYFQGAY